MSEHGRGTDEVFGEAFWDERYRSAQRVWSGNPNPQLVAEVTARPAGRALEAACGEGADAIWLARRGWTVVATDISGVALERAAQHARDTGPDAAARIEWTINVCEARGRPATTPDGAEVTIHDTVLAATRAAAGPAS
jgi:2-polyprenyl-3-methyl-5-hydroxy-6-metoxy-1,4-benzoquinol methylase